MRALQRADVARDIGDLVDRGQGAFGLAEEGAAFTGDDQPLPLPNEKSKSQLAFEIGDQTADGRLRQVQPARSFGHRAGENTAWKACRRFRFIRLPHIRNA